MRIAVSGAHRTGKTTLLDELSHSLPASTRVDEPYHQLVAEGHKFAEMPCLEDFELQLERSIESIDESCTDCLFDRCPCDMLAYLISHHDSDSFDINLWLQRIRRVMKKLDLLVFVQIENPDRATGYESEHGNLRRRVDEELQDIVLGDNFSFGMPVIEVTGSTSERARQVLERIGQF